MAEEPHAPLCPYLGSTLGNYIVLEVLIPHRAPMWKTEDAVIKHLIDDKGLRDLIVNFMEFDMSRFSCVYIHHKQLLFPLWYKRGEGEGGLALRAILRRKAGYELGMVWKTFIRKSFSDWYTGRIPKPRAQPRVADWRRTLSGPLFFGNWTKPFYSVLEISVYKVNPPFFNYERISLCHHRSIRLNYLIMGIHISITCVH